MSPIKSGSGSHLFAADVQLPAVRSPTIACAAELRQSHHRRSSPNGCSIRIGGAPLHSGPPESGTGRATTAASRRRDGLRRRRADAGDIGGGDDLRETIPDVRIRVSCRRSVLVGAGRRPSARPRRPRVRRNSSPGTAGHLRLSRLSGLIHRLPTSGIIRQFPCARLNEEGHTTTPCDMWCSIISTRYHSRSTSVRRVPRLAPHLRQRSPATKPLWSGTILCLRARRRYAGVVNWRWRGAGRRRLEGTEIALGRSGDLIIVSHEGAFFVSKTWARIHKSSWFGVACSMSLMPRSRLNSAAQLVIKIQTLGTRL